MKRLILASMLALILALTALMFGPGETALACQEHQLVTPGTVVDNIARGQTSKPESTEGGRRVSVLKRQEGAPVLLG